MENLLRSYAGSRVLVTGHTGFKGSWLCEWLLALGAEVWGLSLPPPTRPAMFRQLGLAGRMHHIVGDLRDAKSVAKAVGAASPSYVFHLAAQPLVRVAHMDPIATWETNLMGTINVLEQLRTLRRPCAAVIVTTDKVYGASPVIHTEEDTIGAHDPYGASKAAVELAVEAWRRSFFRPSRGRPATVALATARSGNTIGGGDWASDRLVPDCIRSLSKGAQITLRNPSAIRPWQHVLDPLAGYLILGSELRKALVSRRMTRLEELSGPFNFGPAASEHRSVKEVALEILKHWPGTWRRVPDSRGPAETAVLRLNAAKSRRLLGWHPRWRFATSVSKTVDWYTRATSPARARELADAQIAEFMAT